MKRIRRKTLDRWIRDGKVEVEWILSDRDHIYSIRDISTKKSYPAKIVEKGE